MQIKKILNNYNLDIVHIHSPFSIGIDYAKKRKIPIIATIHSQYKQDFLRAVRINWIENILTKKIIKQFNRCDECSTVNSTIDKIIHEEYHC